MGEAAKTIWDQPLIQFLIVFAFAIVFFPIYVGVSYLWARVRGKKFVFVWPTSQGRRMAAAFVPDRNNKISLHVRGWKREELDKILAYFRKHQTVPRSFARVNDISPETFLITFPEDIFPAYIFYLVNYIRYPKYFDLKARSIGVLCRVILTAAFGAPDDKLIGQHATIYVPSDDADYTVVYVNVETRAVYEVSLVKLSWTIVDEARMPEEILGL